MKKQLVAAVFMSGVLMTSLLTFANVAGSGEEKKVQIEGVIQPYDEPVMMSLTLPSELSFNINPNDENGNYFTASEFLISNESDVPLKVSVQGFESVKKTGVYQFTDVLPTEHKDWLSLTEEETMRDFAIGVKVVDASQWSGSVRTETIWAKEVQESSTDIEIGNIPALTENVALTLEAKHGLKFSKWIKPAYDLTLYFEFIN